MKPEGRRTSREHLNFDSVTKVCLCGCGLTLLDAILRAHHFPGGQSITVPQSSRGSMKLVKLDLRPEDWTIGDVKGMILPDKWMEAVLQQKNLEGVCEE